ncbi:type II toxin-antitoxin system Phd/YefM family antitoxin [Baekduia sp. Peel2402]|uniref:type II toxin-antitoxin system Phd/YefM family antitoxin n=1 Tax=Baekduia sp. Peel2402 TaxID=3458296 RepID=UPI00403EB0EF
MPEMLPLSSVKTRLSELVGRVEGEHDRVVVTRNGRPAAVLISYEDLEGLEETLAALSDPKLMQQIRDSEAAATRTALSPSMTFARSCAAIRLRREREPWQIVVTGSSPGSSQRLPSLTAPTCNESHEPNWQDPRNNANS